MTDNPIPRLFLHPVRHPFWGRLVLVLVVAAVIASPITDRWDAAIVQPAQSLRFVESGTVFNTLADRPLQCQDVQVEATVSYRKRSLLYSSGLDFGFRGRYEVTNNEGQDVDVVLVFPIDLQQSKILMSDLYFAVNDRPALMDLGPRPAPTGSPSRVDKLIWSGRIKDGSEMDFTIAYRSHGFHSLADKLDPTLPVRGYRLDRDRKGGLSYDRAGEW